MTESALTSPRTRRLIASVVRHYVPPCEVDDLVQDVLCQALTAPDMQLTVLARRRAIDCARALRNRRKREALWQSTPSTRDCFDAVAARGAVALVRAAIDSDDERVLRWIQLHLDGERYAELAAREGCSAISVRIAVCRFRKRMRKLLTAA